MSNDLPIGPVFRDSPKVPTSTVIGCLAPIVVTPVALLVAIKTDGLPKLIAIAILCIIAIWYSLIALDRDPLSAWQNERLNRIAPWLQRNEDIGKTAVAIENFVENSGEYTGKVSLEGEIWNAICKDGIPVESGIELFVVARESLTLVVSLSEDSVPRGLPW